MVADLLWNAAQSDPALLCSLRTHRRSFRRALNPSSSSTEGQKIPSSDVQLPSPRPRPAMPSSIVTTLSMLPTPFSIMRERRQPKITKKGDPNIEVILRVALPSSDVQLTLPTPSDPISPHHPRNRRVSDDPAIPNIAKKQKTESLPEPPEGLF